MLQSHPAEVHIKDPPRFYGTPLFASIASLRGGLPCPADDVEALLYSLLSMGAPPNYGGRAVLPFEVGVGSDWCVHAFVWAAGSVLRCWQCGGRHCCISCYQGTLAAVRRCHVR